MILINFFLFIQKTEECLEFQKRLNDVTEEKDKVKIELQELRDELEQVKTNYSSLLLTAKAEIKRKNNQIADIRKQYVKQWNELNVLLQNNFFLNYFILFK